jgi:RNA polymerase sigma-70 factor (sigma-E family)
MVYASRCRRQAGEAGPQPHRQPGAEQERPVRTLNAGSTPGTSAPADEAAADWPAADGTAPDETAPDETADEVIRAAHDAHAVQLVRVALLLVGDRASAEDVVQDAFLGLYQGLPRLRDPGKVLPYLRAAVINGSRSALRARRRAALRPVPADPPVWSAESAVLAGEERREVLAAVARLPRRAREVLALRYYLDLPDREIAAALGVSRGTVSSTASRALAALARELKEES